MPLNARQLGSVKSLLRKASEHITDAQNIASSAADISMVARMKALRRNVADEIADLDREAAQAGGKRT
jgi:hypothetical protein